MELVSKNIQLRFAEEEDADFILGLRLDSKFNRFLSKVSSDIEAQRNWLRIYKGEERLKKQFYFIIERLDGVSCGTVRVYDLRSDSFCWGSWILNEKKTKYASIESAYLIYHFGFNALGYSQSHFDVVKENKSVIKFHERMGAVKIGEDTNNFYFSITKESVEKSKIRLGKFL